jgi:hypothetical protein
MNTLTKAIGASLDKHYEDGLAEGRRLSAKAIERRDSEIDNLRAALNRIRGRLISTCQDNDLMTDEDAEAIAQADAALNKSMSE